MLSVGSACGVSPVLRIYSLSHMPRNDTGRVRARHLAVVTVVAALVAGWMYLRGDLNSWLCDGPCGPIAVAAPEGIEEVEPGAVTTVDPSDAPIDGDALARAVADDLAHRHLGTDAGFYAADLRDGSGLTGSDTHAHIPASITKLLSGYAALEALGPETRFTTEVRRDGDTLVLVGGGDPYLYDVTPEDVSSDVADLRTLAERTAKALGPGAGPVSLAYDLSLFEGPVVAKSWKPSYVTSGAASKVTPLTIDRYGRGHVRPTDQPGHATRRFAELLRAAGVEVTGSIAETTGTAGAGEKIAQVRSAPVAELVEAVVAYSNNDGAEMLARHVAIARGEKPTFAGAAKAIEDVLADHDVSTTGLVLRDASGLSRENRMTARTIVDTLVAANSSPRTARLFTGMPVAGFNGTLGERFTTRAEATQGRGWVRAKTGGLNGVVNLAGVATLSDGRPVAFAIMADRTDGISPLDVQPAIDRVASAIASCTC